MAVLQIDRMRATYHLPASMRGERRRLDSVLHDMLAETLERAVERVSPESEPVCIRALDVPVRVRLDGTDASLGVDWSVAVAEAVADAIRGGGSGVIRYASQAQALFDVAARVTDGDLRRSWAWRQLGLWAGKDEAAPPPGEQLTRFLLESPGLIAPILEGLGDSGRIGALVALLPPTAWPTLARAALSAAGADPARGSGPSKASRDELRRAERMVWRSSLAGALLAARIDGVIEAWPEAVAALVATAADPGALRSAGGGPAFLAAIERALVRQVAEPTMTPAPDGSHHPVPQGAELATGRPRTEEVGVLGARRDHEPTNRHRRPGERTARVSPEPVSRPAPEVPPTRDALSADDEPAMEARPRGRTRAGGLFFLLHVVDDLALPDAIVVDPAFAGRPVRWVLHALGLALCPLAMDDPAALGFCGIAPGRTPPSVDEPAPSDVEAEAIGALARRVSIELAARLRRSGVEGSEDEVVRMVCMRDAEVVADPGWIEVRLAIRDVSTEIRRAGLDLELGYLPWLGMVVRLLYE